MRPEVDKSPLDTISTDLSEILKSKFFGSDVSSGAKIEIFPVTSRAIPVDKLEIAKSLSAVWAAQRTKNSSNFDKLRGRQQIEILHLNCQFIVFYTSTLKGVL